MSMEYEIARLQEMTVGQLQARYREVFGESTKGHNKSWLAKRIAWRLQVIAEGTLSERARRRAEELADEAHLRVTIPKQQPVPLEPSQTATLSFQEHDDRVPIPGSFLVREYKGRTIHVQVLADGFEWNGEQYASLSAVAKAITGSHINGYLFFRLSRKAVKA